MVQRLHPNSARRSKRGFNLIESAIVLGLVGSVIGGVWVAAAAVSENMKMNHTESAMLEIVTGLRQKITRSNWPGIKEDMWGSVEALKIMPADFIDHKDPWGNYVEVEWGSASPVVEIGIHNLTQSRCIKLVSAVTSHYSDNSDLIGIWMSDTWLDTWPVSPTNTLCQEQNTYVGFFFTLDQ
jgi:hypothetical protein